MKNVLVTGASRGLGLSIVKKLVEDGYFVIGVSRTETAELKELKAEKPDAFQFYPYDFDDLGGIPDLVKEIVANHGFLYGLVNNAAIGSDGLLATQHATDISRALRINLEAPITLTKYATRSMFLNGEGRVINVSSIIASTGFSGLSVYGATKAGLVGFTRSLSREMARAQITVNALAPGYMETEMTAGLQGEKLQSIRRRAPLGLPAPDDVSGMVRFLLSSESSKTTGAVFTIDGGSTA